jgi:hypothetical protein
VQLAEGIALSNNDLKLLREKERSEDESAWQEKQRNRSTNPSVNGQYFLDTPANFDLGSFDNSL